MGNILIPGPGDLQQNLESRGFYSTRDY